METSDIWPVGIGGHKKRCIRDAPLAQLERLAVESGQCDSLKIAIEELQDLFPPRQRRVPGSTDA